MSLPTAAAVELLEAEAWADMHGRFAELPVGEGASVRRWGRETALAMSNVPVVAVNRAIGCGFDRPLDAQSLGQIRSFYRQAGKERWFVECSPSASIDYASLERAGGRVGGQVIKLVGDLESVVDLPGPTLEIVVATSDDASAFMTLVGAQLGVPERARMGMVAPIGSPGWTYYLALDDGRAVAGAALFTSGAGSWLGLAGTLPEYRRRGAQISLLARRLEDARRAGCLWTSAETSLETDARNPSLHNMKRLGLVELYHRTWMRFDEDQSTRGVQ